MRSSGASVGGRHSIVVADAAEGRCRSPRGSSPRPTGPEAQVLDARRSRPLGRRIGGVAGERVADDADVRRLDPDVAAARDAAPGPLISGAASTWRDAGPGRPRPSRDRRWDRARARGRRERAGREKQQQGGKHNAHAGPLSKACTRAPARKRKARACARPTPGRAILSALSAPCCQRPRLCRICQGSVTPWKLSSGRRGR